MRKSHRRAPRPSAPPPPPADPVLRFKCPCGASLKIAPSQVDGRGVCSRCRRRILLEGKTGPDGRIAVHPLLLDDSERSSGRTFLIEDHFRELSPPPRKIGFRCPCGRALFAKPEMVDRRGKCPGCGARLLLVGKLRPRSRAVEIHPLVVEEPRSGDTMMIDGLS